MSTMDKESMQDHILNAINIIKSKRARPDQNRITELVLKTLEPNSTSSSFDLKKRILTELESAVSQGLVIKVRYKEGISYRNPGSTSRGQGRIYPDDSNGNDEDDQQEEQKVGSEKRAAVTSQATSNDGSGTNGTGMDSTNVDTKMSVLIQRWVSRKCTSRVEVRLVRVNGRPPDHFLIHSTFVPCLWMSFFRYRNWYQDW